MHLCFPPSPQSFTPSLCRCFLLSSHVFSTLRLFLFVVRFPLSSPLPPSLPPAALLCLSPPFLPVLHLLLTPLLPVSLPLSPRVVSAYLSWCSSPEPIHFMGLIPFLTVCLPVWGQLSICLVVSPITSFHSHTPATVTFSLQPAMMLHHVLSRFHLPRLDFPFTASHFLCFSISTLV